LLKLYVRQRYLWSVGI